MDAPPPVPPPVPSIPPPLAERTSGTAVASLVLGILAFVTCGLTAIPAVICGHLGLSSIGRAAGRLGGRGMAVAGLITGYLSMAFLLVALLAGIGLPVISEVRHRADATRAMNQLKQIGVACHAYAEQHEGRFPETLDELVPQYLPAEALVVPVSGEAGETTNFEYFGGKLTDPPDQVVAATAPHGKQRRRAFLYMDGRVEYKAEPPIAK